MYISLAGKKTPVKNDSSSEESSSEEEEKPKVTPLKKGKYIGFRYVP